MMVYPAESTLIEFTDIMFEAQAYMDKAVENLASCESELDFGRRNSCARSAYYACFQAAIAALLNANVVSAQSGRRWSHDHVQSRFVGELINREKKYPASLRSTLPDLLAIRHKADYEVEGINDRVAQQVVRRAQFFVQAVREELS
jgi:uncharacterized protein (UPF0332 family)